MLCGKVVNDDVGSYILAVTSEVEVITMNWVEDDQNKMLIRYYVKSLKYGSSINHGNNWWWSKL
jgi:hypothetical protein